MFQSISPVPIRQEYPHSLVNMKPKTVTALFNRRFHSNSFILYALNSTMNHCHGPWCFGSCLVVVLQRGSRCPHLAPPLHTDSDILTLRSYSFSLFHTSNAVRSVVRPPDLLLWKIKGRLTNGVSDCHVVCCLGEIGVLHCWMVLLD